MLFYSLISIKLRQTQPDTSKGKYFGYAMSL